MAGGAAMNQAIEAYLAMRRAVGFKLLNDDGLLRSFAHFAATQDESIIRTTTAITWAGQSKSVAQRDVRLKVVCRFARYIRLEDCRHELPPADHFAYRRMRRSPFIYTCDELNRLIESALQLRSLDALYSHTYATLIALLAVTGLRVSEALRLRFSDVTSDGLLIHKTKFRKSRMVPLHDTVSEGLGRYLTRRRSLGSRHAEVFVTDDGQPLKYSMVYYTFQKLLRDTKLYPESTAPRPRLHDFRHRFAVNALRNCPPGTSTSASQHMLALATYLGHSNITDTYWYLEATPELLSGIAIESESFFLGRAQL